MSKSHYDLLEISSSASLSEIRSAYRRLAKKLHPDLNKSRAAAKKFIAIKVAYDAVVADLSRSTAEELGRGDDSAEVQPSDPPDLEQGELDSDSHGPGPTKWPLSRVAALIAVILVFFLLFGFCLWIGSLIAGEPTFIWQHK